MFRRCNLREFLYRTYSPNDRRENISSALKNMENLANTNSQNGGGMFLCLGSLRT